MCLWTVHEAAEKVLINVRACTHSGCVHGRLNWQLHFGEPPKWSKGVKFILVDVEPSQVDAAKAALVLRGDAAAVAEQLSSTLIGLDPSRFAQWRGQLHEKASTRTLRLSDALFCAGRVDQRQLDLETICWASNSLA